MKTENLIKQSEKEEIGKHLVKLAGRLGLKRAYGRFDSSERKFGTCKVACLSPGGMLEVRQDVLDCLAYNAL